MRQDARIWVRKPNISELTNQEFTVADLHTHTNHSDGLLSVEQMLTIAKKNRLGIAITDHNEATGALKAKPFAKEQLIIPGIEFHPFEGMHILAYFYEFSELEEFFTKHILPFRGKGKLGSLSEPCESLVDYAQDFNCILSAAHPHAASWTGLCKHDGKERLDQRMLQKIQCVEAINGGNLGRWNKKTIKLAIEKEYKITAGSDAHTQKEIGSAVSYTRYPTDRAGTLDAIKKNQNIIIGKPLGFTDKAVIQVQKFTKGDSESGNRFATGLRHVKNNKIERNKRKAVEIANKVKNLGKKIKEDDFFEMKDP